MADKRLYIYIFGIPPPLHTLHEFYNFSMVLPNHSRNPTARIGASRHNKPLSLMLFGLAGGSRLIPAVGGGGGGGGISATSPVLFRGIF